MKQDKQNQIIFFFPMLSIGGVEKNFFIISNFLANKINNTKFSLISLNNIFFLKKKINKKIKIIHSNKKLFFFSRRLKFIYCMYLLMQQCIKNQNSVIFSFQGNFYALVVSWLFNTKIIVRSNLSPQAWCGGFIKKKVFKFLLSKSNLIIVNSSKFKKEFKEYFKLNTIKIYNPISRKINKFNNVKNKIIFFKKNKINLINIGRFVKQKNQSEIINALDKVKNRDKFRLLLIGDGPEKKNLIKLIKDKKLKKVVKITNNQMNKDLYLSKSDIFILSSINEGLPNVLLEAAVNKKYLISSNCPTGPSEIINQYKYGEIYKLKSTENLTKILNKFITDKNLLNKLRKNIDLKSDLFKYNLNLNRYLAITNKILI